MAEKLSSGGRQALNWLVGQLEEELVVRLPGSGLQQPLRFQPGASLPEYEPDSVSLSEGVAEEDSWRELPLSGAIRDRLRWAGAVLRFCRHPDGSYSAGIDVDRHAKESGRLFVVMAGRDGRTASAYLGPRDKDVRLEGKALPGWDDVLWAAEVVD